MNATNLANEYKLSEITFKVLMSKANILAANVMPVIFFS